ncbi:hypothetical protein TcCL_NonESM11907 [Trypanosoma cruzi]|nr:hypothetical protein TcCL_NonESM11907 [Trypanosoma cruzi]
MGVCRIWYWPFLLSSRNAGMRAVCQSLLNWECQHRHPLRVSTVPSDDVAPCRGVEALVAYRNSAAGRCCEHDGDQGDFTPREGSAPCPVWGGEAVCLQTVGQNCTTVSQRSLR